MIPSQLTRKSYLSVSIAALLAHVTVALSSSALANETTDSKSIDTVVIVGEKINKTLKNSTAAVTVMTEETFENGEIRELDDLVVSAPNVNEAAFGSISIRGVEGAGAATGGFAFYSGSRARVSTVVDNDAQAWSGYSFTPSKLWDTKQVEVLRGPQSTSQGTNSIGGTVVVTTNDPTYHWEGAVRAGLETYENGNVKYNTALVTSGPIIDNELAFRLALDGEKGEGWMNYAADDVDLDDYPDFSESENINARLKVLWEPEHIPDLSVKVTANVKSYDGEYLNWANDGDDYDSQTLTVSVTNRDNTRLQDSKVTSIATDVDYQVTPSVTNSLHLGYGSSDVAFTQYPNTFDVDSSVDMFIAENKVLFQDPQSATSSIVGLYYSNTDTYSNVADATIRNGEVTTTAVYGETTHALTSQAKLVAGARLENEDNTSVLDSSYYGDHDVETNTTIFLPKLGLIYDIDQSTTVNASIRKGYNAGGYAFNWDESEYYSYDEESVIAYEMGMRNTIGAAEISTNLFFNDYTDYVAYDSDGYFKNIDDSHTYGIEVEGTFWATDSIKLRGSYGFLATEITSSDNSYKGNKLTNAPEQNLSVGVTHYLGEDLSYNADLFYVGEYYSDLSNSDDYKAGEYVTANISLQYTLGDYVIDGYVKNLTDEDIVYTAQSSGRAAVGQTRTFGVNATYRW